MANERILIAEDNATIAKIFQFILRNHGYEVEVTLDGAEAWDRVQKENFDLVITDHNMPKMKGIELCLRLRSLEAYESTPIIIATAYGHEMTPAILRELGITDVISKPFVSKDLLQVVEKCLAAPVPV